MNNFFKNLIKKLFYKYCLTKHKFFPSTLIIRNGTRVLFEVDTNYYNTDFEPVTIVRAFPNGTQLLGIGHHDIIEYVEYKKPVDEKISVTPHDNDKFADYSKKEIIHKRTT